MSVKFHGAPMPSLWAQTALPSRGTLEPLSLPPGVGQLKLMGFFITTQTTLMSFLCRLLTQQIRGPLEASIIRNYFVGIFTASKAEATDCTFQGAWIFTNPTQ